MEELPMSKQIEIVETPITGLPGRTPREQILDEKPLVSGKKEPIFLIDLSGSNFFEGPQGQAGPDSPMTKKELLMIAVPLAAGKLGKDDSMAASEVGTDKGGVRSYGFNEPDRFEGWDEEEEEFDDPRDLGDLSEANVQEKLGNAPWGGRTFIMPAIRAAVKAFVKEFPDGDTTAEMVIWTDGQLNDQDQFEHWLEGVGKDASFKAVVAVAVLGYGDGHDQAVKEYKKIADSNNHISVAALTGVSDPSEVVLDVQLMAA